MSTKKQAAKAVKKPAANFMKRLKDALANIDPPEPKMIRAFRGEVIDEIAVPGGRIMADNPDYAAKFIMERPTKNKTVTYLDVPEDTWQRGLLENKDPGIEETFERYVDPTKSAFIVPGLAKNRKRLIGAAAAATVGAGAAASGSNLFGQRVEVRDGKRYVFPAGTPDSDVEMFFESEKQPFSLREDIAEPLVKGLTGVDVPASAGGEIKKSGTARLSEMAGEVAPYVAAAVSGGVSAGPQVARAAAGRFTRVPLVKRALTGAAEALGFEGIRQGTQQVAKAGLEAGLDTELKGEGLDLDMLLLSGAAGGATPVFGAAWKGLKGAVKGAKSSAATSPVGDFVWRSGKTQLENMGPGGVELARAVDRAVNETQRMIGKTLTRAETKTGVGKSFRPKTSISPGNLLKTSEVAHDVAFTNAMAGLSPRAQLLAKTPAAQRIINAAKDNVAPLGAGAHEIAVALSSAADITRLGQVGPTLSNLSQVTYIPLQSSWRSFLGAAKDMTSKVGREEARRLALEAGSLSDTLVRRAYALQKGGIQKAGSETLQIGYSPVEVFNRAFGAAAAKREVEMLSRAAATGDAAAARRLGEMGLNAKKLATTGVPSKKDVLDAAQWMNNKVNFRGNALDLPGAFYSPAGKFWLKYKSFGYQAASLYRQSIMEAIKNKDISKIPAIGSAAVVGPILKSGRSLLTAIGATVAVGGGPQVLDRAWQEIYDKPRAFESFFGQFAGDEGAAAGRQLDMLAEASAFGIMMDGLRAVAGGSRQATQFIEPPGVGVVMDALDIPLAATRGDTGGAARRVLRMTPGVGSFVPPGDVDMSGPGAMPVTPVKPAQRRDR